MNLWKVDGENLLELPKDKLNSEERLEKWIEKNNSLLGLDILIFGKQVITTYGGRIDLLALDMEGNIVILELKKDKTPRDVVAQALDYASWVNNDLTYNDIEKISNNYLKRPIREAFFDRFESDFPDEINNSHSIVIVASELDASSERIVQYLSSEYKININCIFFDFFKDQNNEYLGRSWLMDPEEVSERSITNKTAPWSGLYYVNVGDGEFRSWEDCAEYGFLSAGQGKKYSDPIKKLKVGDKVLAYLKGQGYVGYGEVVSTAVMAKDFKVIDGSYLFDNSLLQSNIKMSKDIPELADWTVGIKWIKTVSKENALRKKGIFANQNIVCKLRDKETIEFLKEPFSIEVD